MNVAGSHPPLPPMLIMFNIQLACRVPVPAYLPQGVFFQLLSANKISLSFCLYLQMTTHSCMYVGTRYSPRRPAIETFAHFLISVDSIPNILYMINPFHYVNTKRSTLSPRIRTFPRTYQRNTCSTLPIY
jgi:hypothetical protein